MSARSDSISEALLWGLPRSMCSMNSSQMCAASDHRPDQDDSQASYDWFQRAMAHEPAVSKSGRS